LPVRGVGQSPCWPSGGGAEAARIDRSAASCSSGAGTRCGQRGARIAAQLQAAAVAQAHGADSANRRSAASCSGGAGTRCGLRGSPLSRMLQRSPLSRMLQRGRRRTVRTARTARGTRRDGVPRRRRGGSRNGDGAEGARWCRHAVRTARIAAEQNAAAVAQAHGADYAHHRSAASCSGGAGTRCGLRGSPLSRRLQRWRRHTVRTTRITAQQQAAAATQAHGADYADRR
jgi:hypothetical protein